MRHAILALTLTLVTAAPTLAQDDAQRDKQLEQRLAAQQERERQLIAELQHARELINGHAEEEVHAEHYRVALLDGAHTKLEAAVEDPQIDPNGDGKDDREVVQELRKLAERVEQPYTNLLDLCVDGCAWPVRRPCSAASTASCASSPRATTPTCASNSTGCALRSRQRSRSCASASTRRRTSCSSKRAPSTRRSATC